MLRKKTHVVRKKTHVVRKFFYVASIFGGVARRRNTPITASVSSGAAFVFTASISGGAGNGINRMLRKKFHDVRKKYHVVRKLFYVASIFGGAAGRKNRPPWELSSTAGDFSSTASRRRQRLQCVYRAPVFYRGAHTSLPDTNSWISSDLFSPWHRSNPLGFGVAHLA